MSLWNRVVISFRRTVALNKLTVDQLAIGITLPCELSGIMCKIFGPALASIGLTRQLRFLLRQPGDGQPVRTTQCRGLTSACAIEMSVTAHGLLVEEVEKAMQSAWSAGVISRVERV
jgi:hypothetical protein